MESRWYDWSALTDDDAMGPRWGGTVGQVHAESLMPVFDVEPNSQLSRLFRAIL